MAVPSANPSVPALPSCGHPASCSPGTPPSCQPCCAYSRRNWQGQLSCTGKLGTGQQSTGSLLGKSCWEWCRCIQGSRLQQSHSTDGSAPWPRSPSVAAGSPWSPCNRSKAASPTWLLTSDLRSSAWPRTPQLLDSPSGGCFTCRAASDGSTQPSQRHVILLAARWRKG